MTKIDDLRDRIARVLGWSAKDVDSFSLPTLRELIRPKHPQLVAEIDETLRTGAHLFTKESRR
jgi:hypothetical protein